MTGQTFGLWTVLRFAGHRGNVTRWVARCKCGTEKEVFRRHLIHKESTSCGCGPTAHRRSHQMSHTPDYQRWLSMFRRCYETNNPKYPAYGGRGIVVCERWHKFENYFADMGRKPKGMSLDRIDNDGPYSPENCRWASPQQQARNTQKSRYITFKGETLCLREWELRMGGSGSIVGSRLRRGWTIEAALTTPPYPRYSKVPSKT